MAGATSTRMQNPVRPQTTARSFNPAFIRSADRRPAKPKAEPETLFQTYFKSVGPRTYAAQVKRASNENQFLVLTEGKRDEKTGEVRKTRLFIFSEDFEAYLSMLREAAHFLKANPVSPEVRARRAKYWAKHPPEQPMQKQPPADTTPAPSASPPRPGLMPATRRPSAATPQRSRS